MLNCVHKVVTWSRVISEIFCENSKSGLKRTETTNRKLLKPSHYSQHRNIGYGSFKVRKAHNFGHRLKKPFKLGLTFQCSSKTKIFPEPLSWLYKHTVCVL